MRSKLCTNDSITFAGRSTFPGSNVTTGAETQTFDDDEDQFEERMRKLVERELE